MKIIFMGSSGVTTSAADLMCIDYLKDYYSYEIWDLSIMYNKEGAAVSIDGCMMVENESKFEEMLKKEASNKKTVIISNMTLDAWSVIEPVATKYGVPIICVQKQRFQALLDDLLAFDFSFKMPFKARIRRIGQLNSVFRKMRLLKYHGVKLDYMVGCCDIRPEESKKFVMAHDVKYDEYRRNIESENFVGRPYILFIDCALCYHPIDFTIPDPVFDVEHYLKQLNNYFDLLESKYGLPVIVSLHPCSVNRLNSDNFGGRMITYSKTAQLVQHAEFVVSHFSTSLINVILAKKADIFLTSEEIENSVLRYRPQVQGFALAKACDFSIDSLDKPILPEPNVNEKKYNDFTDKYLVNKNFLNKSNGEIIRDLLEKMEKEL